MSKNSTRQVTCLIFFTVLLTGLCTQVLAMESGSAIAQPPSAKKTSAPNMLKTPTKIRLALTLAGGGSRGVAHIGVLKVLHKEGIEPDLITGSSVGAMIGSLYAAGLTPEEIEKLALNGDLKKAYFPRPRFLQSIIYGARYGLSRLMFLKPKIGLYSGRSIARFIENNLPSGVTEFKDLKIPLVVTSLNLIDTKPVWISSGKVSFAVRVSNTVPFMYRSPGSIEGPQLVDGGIRSNLPTGIADALGAPLVVAVKLHSYLEKSPRKEFDTNLEYADRVTSILMAEIEGKAVGTADIIIEPKVEFMTMHTFDEEHLKCAIKAGELAALQKLQAIKAGLHAIEQNRNQIDIIKSRVNHPKRI
ncbi:MAG TPA: patatin-like phospholipase family protein [Candidatus Melainabacteria bacterium]|jgi:NTE family protein|nr:patatin-like phospholipase family protein [Candidatus Melainabacteria bacterium]HIN63369.1 patatin-like phospholipase family protein [Candidatus Obscuribacterales bacterium]